MEIVYNLFKKFVIVFSSLLNYLLRCDELEEYFGKRLLNSNSVIYFNNNYSLYNLYFSLNINHFENESNQHNIYLIPNEPNGVFKHRSNIINDNIHCYIYIYFTK